MRSVPNNRMKFPGIRDAKARADLIVYLQQAGSGQAGTPEDEGGMMGDRASVIFAEPPEISAMIESKC